MAENFPDPGKETDVPVQRVPDKMNTKRSTPTHIIVKLLKGTKKNPSSNRNL